MVSNVGGQGFVASLLAQAGVELVSLAVDRIVAPVARSAIENIGERLERRRRQQAELQSVTQFWATDRTARGGEYVAIDGALSTYVPVLVGPPRVKREIHRTYRRSIAATDYGKDRTTIDALLAFTAGQMIWRLAFDSVDYVYLGLYHSIARNSIIIAVEKDYYSRSVERIFTEGGRRHVVEARVTGQLEPVGGSLLKKFLSDHDLEGVIRPQILQEVGTGCPVLWVDGRDTEIKYLGNARYLDGDIWVAIEQDGQQSFVSRFVDLADEEDLREELDGLRSDVRQYFPDSRVVFQFDQVERMFEYSTKEQLLNELLNVRRPARG